VTEGFQFLLYSLDYKDARGNPIDSMHRRRFLFNLGFWDALLRDMPSKEKEDLRRVVFFTGSFFFSARPIPGLDPASLPLPLAMDRQAEGDTIRLVKVEQYTAPVELTIPVESVGSNDIKADKRCGDCTKSFTDVASMIQHW